MKLAKILLAGTFAVAAVALSVAPSEAAKKKKEAKAAACTPGMSCVRKDGVRQVCGGDGKWVAVLAPACTDANCGPKC